MWWGSNVLEGIGFGGFARGQESEEGKECWRLDIEGVLGAVPLSLPYCMFALFEHSLPSDR